MYGEVITMAGCTRDVPLCHVNTRIMMKLFIIDRKTFSSSPAHA